MRLVHLAPQSRTRGIRRAGLAGAKATLVASAGSPIGLRNAIFAMPVVSDFWTTFQWLRELRRAHDERMVAVYFRVSDDEIVHVGRYGQPHTEMKATAAAAWVMKSPAGAQIVVPRRVPAKDILAVRQNPQLVGWTEVPEPDKKFDCVCPACLPSGDRAFMRRIRAAFAAGLSAARIARTDGDLLSALGRLDVPLERARGRLEPKSLLAIARSDSPSVRRAVTRLLGFFRWSQVDGVLKQLLLDDDEATRLECVEAMARTAGIRRTASLIADGSNDLLVLFLELVEYRQVDNESIVVLERFADHSEAAVRESVRRVARALLEDFQGARGWQRRLESLA